MASLDIFPHISIIHLFSCFSMCSMWLEPVRGEDSGSRRAPFCGGLGEAAGETQSLILKMKE